LYNWHLLFAYGVVTPGVVVSGIFFAGDELLCTEKLAVGACPDLICKQLSTKLSREPKSG
jgi:hypothetical protein